MAAEDSLIIVRYDQDAGRAVYDIGDLDPWSAVTMLRQVAKTINDSLPEAISSDVQIEDAEYDAEHVDDDDV